MSVFLNISKTVGNAVGESVDGVYQWAANTVGLDDPKAKKTETQFQAQALKPVYHAIAGAKNVGASVLGGIWKWSQPEPAGKEDYPLREGRQVKGGSLPEGTSIREEGGGFYWATLSKGTVIELSVSKKISFPKGAELEFDEEGKLLKGGFYLSQELSAGSKTYPPGTYVLIGGDGMFFSSEEYHQQDYQAPHLLNNYPVQGGVLPRGTAIREEDGGAYWATLSKETVIEFPNSTKISFPKGAELEFDENGRFLKGGFNSPTEIKIGDNTYPAGTYVLVGGDGSVEFRKLPKDL